jgi:transcriptional regulator with XRE-family HTH domain
MIPKLGDRLQLLIREKGLQQQEIAALLGIKVPTFNGYITNKREPSVEKLILFARFFNVSIDYLVGYSDERNPYLTHLSDEMSSFVKDPGNNFYLELARDVKARTAANKGIKGVG